jgi:hypothetical protein
LLPFSISKIRASDFDWVAELFGEERWFHWSSILPEAGIWWAIGTYSEAFLFFLSIGDSS